VRDHGYFENVAREKGPISIDRIKSLNIEPQ